MPPTRRLPRLATLRTALACARLTVLACGRSTSPTAPGGPAPVAAVGVSRASASLQAGTTLPLAAIPQDTIGCSPPSARSAARAGA